MARQSVDASCSPLQQFPSDTHFPCEHPFNHTSKASTARATTSWGDNFSSPYSHQPTAFIANHSSMAPAKKKLAPQPPHKPPMRACLMQKRHPAIVVTLFLQPPC